MKNKYAIVAKVRKQVVDIVEDLTPINQEFHLVVDLTNHPQKDDVNIDWFYDAETNEFSAEGEVYYPEPEPEPEPTEAEIAQAEILLMQTEIIANQNDQEEVLAEILLNQMGG